MALPGGITTCAVTFGSDYDFGGGLVSSKMTVTPSVDVVWSATGQRLVSFNITATADAGMPGSLALPHVDQGGFTDGSGNDYTMWSYKLFVEYTGQSGAREDVTKFFQPLVGQTSVDFDNIPGGVVTIPVSAPVMPVTSLNGETGAIDGIATTADLGNYVAQPTDGTVGNDTTFLRGDGSWAAPSDARPALNNDPTGKSDRTIAAGMALDSGTIYNQTSFHGADATQTGGVWTHPNVQSVGTNNASYVQMQVSSDRVRRFGCEARFPSTTGLPAIALVCPSSPWDASTSPATLPVAGVHFSFNSNGLIALAMWNPVQGQPGHIDHHLVPGSATALTLQLVNSGGTQTTASITTIDAAHIQSALAALSNVGAGKVTVTTNIDGTFSILWDASLGAAGSQALTISTSTGANSVTAVYAYGTSTTIYTGGQTTLADMRDGITWWKFEIWIYPESNQLVVMLPDGSTTSITHQAIGAYTGATAVFELFESNLTITDPPASIRKTWVDNFKATTDSRIPNRADVVTTVQSVKRIVREYSGAGTWTPSVPAGCVGARFYGIAPGGGGGSGARQAAGTASCGGGAGSSGGVLSGWIPSSLLTSGSYSLTILAAGTGGAAVTADSTNGNNGTNAGAIVFATTPTGGIQYDVRIVGGGLGNAGTTVNGPGGGVAGTSNTPLGLAGGAAGGAGAAPTAGLNAYNGWCGQSGAGGGINTSNTATAGAAGGAAFPYGAAAGGSGGVVGGASPGAGTAAQSARSGDGAGGGAASTTGAAQAGANGAGYGSGGSGGGASRNGNNSGKGGDGGPGYFLIEFFIV